MSDEELKELRKRILLPWQISPGTTIWVPMGDTKWSAIDVKRVDQVWGRGMRVNPSTLKERSKGKFKLSRVLRRDPKLKGKDKPPFAPPVVFAQFIAAEAKAKEEEEERKERTRLEEELRRQEEATPTPPKMTPEERAESIRRAEALFELFDHPDDATTDDW